MHTYMYTIIVQYDVRPLPRLPGVAAPRATLEGHDRGANVIMIVNSQL